LIRARLLHSYQSSASVPLLVSDEQNVGLDVTQPTVDLRQLVQYLNQHVDAICILLRIHHRYTTQKSSELEQNSSSSPGVVSSGSKLSVPVTPAAFVKPATNSEQENLVAFR